MTVLPRHGPPLALGVSGSVAIYRALDLLRELKRDGLEATVMLTQAATKLISPLLFEAVSGQRVLHDLFEEGRGGDPYDHLCVAREARLLVLAPATADLIGRLASGLGNDLVSTTALAFLGPRLLAPAMNWRMWKNPLVQRNLEILRQTGYRIIPPGEGELACGEEGPGRLAEVSTIIQAVKTALKES